MERARQISVSLENKPGRLAHLCRCLADRKVNIIALSVVETSEQGVVRLVVDKPDEAVKMLKGCPMTFTQSDVLLLELPNRVGILAELAEKLSAKKVNVSFVYGSTGKGRGNTFVVLGAANLRAAEKALGAK
jgi:hypothetical protein